MTDKTYKILCGKLFDGVHHDLYTDVEILIKNDRIVEVGKQLLAPEGTETVDLSDKTVTPGMIDAHVHLAAFEWQNKKRESIYNSPTWKTLAILYSAQQSLHRGFTTLRHVGCSSFDGYGSIDVRRAIDAGYYYGPRLRVAPSYLGVNGGPADHSQALKTNYMMSEAMRDHYRSIGTGPDFFTNAVREQQKLGADLIKIMVSGSFYSPDSSPDMIYFRNDELRAVIDTAESLHIPVTAHVYGPDAVIKLAKMGINCIEHGSLMNDEAVQVMEQTKTDLVPTFFPFDVVASPDPLPTSDHFMRAKLDRYAERLRAGRERIVKSRIRLGYGTDLVFEHNNYDNGWEYSCWLRSGMDPFRTLKAATSVNAEIIGMKDVGRIEPGCYADIAAWNRDLLTDHLALLDCAFVMKGGRIFQAKCALDDD